jgi:hypothetical protein
MNEMKCDEDKIEYIQGKTQAPLKPCHRDGKHQVPPCKEVKQVTSSGLVKISACCLFVSMYFISVSPFSTWALKKWCLTFMCFTLP